jgi:hypothetical protein
VEVREWKIEIVKGAGPPGGQNNGKSIDYVLADT